MILILNEKEQAVLELIRQHPFYAQQEIAEQIGLSRSAVANMISDLIRRNYLLGRAYIINDEVPVVCIGGMNVDRKFYAKQELILKTSNPVSSSVSIGGVGRNIAENLGRLGENVVMLSRAGDDQDWDLIKSASESYMNLRQVDICPEEATSSYTAIIDIDGDMSMALANMAICDGMTVSWLEQYENLLSRSKALVVDLNLPQESLVYLIKLARERNLALAIIPVSAPKMVNLPKDLTGVEWLIVNQDESEIFFDKSLGSSENLESLAKLWLQTGLKQVLITRGAKSMLYANQDGKRQVMTPKMVQQMVDATGAGDSLSAGILFGWLNEFSSQETLEFGLTNAYYTIQSQDTVRKNLSRQSFLQERKELFTHES
ncbi:PfkB family carbohydrate kinase [Streptococcus zalophi]|uniref:Winged helix-turn-helix transcriptional regulator n=1 Tax=Streptococcus zalophi TaxID=640031 RepID=A0A934PBI5_9STRE|nr:winged helix-turn-helix transcriptional regulator [Streptococcus zalophi]